MSKLINKSFNYRIEYYKTIYEFNNDIICIVSRSGCLLYGTTQFTKTFRYPGEVFYYFVFDLFRKRADWELLLIKNKLTNIRLKSRTSNRCKLFSITCNKLENGSDDYIIEFKGSQ